MIDILMVPNGLKDGVGKPHDHDILYGFFPEVMVDAINLGFFEHIANGSIDSFGGGQIMADGFFDNHSRIHL